MELNSIKEKLRDPSYNFLKENENLGTNIVLLTMGGSIAYGTDIESSDIDLRGVSLNSKKEILLGKDFETFVDVKTDTTIYSTNKILFLLECNNPNTLELLGVKPEHIMYSNDIGKLLIDNRRIFLSKVCIHTFSGYAEQQLRRLENKAAGLTTQAKQEVHILKSIENASYEFKNRYMKYCAEEFIKLYVDESDRCDMDKEIFMDIYLKHYPLRDFAGMISEMQSIVKSYSKLGKRNEHAMSHDKLGKHMEHLIRLYMTCIDILLKEEIIVYREDEHDLLMSIRRGEYLDENRQPKKEFFTILNDYTKRLEFAKKHTKLPDIPDRKAIDNIRMDINDRIVRGLV